MVFPPSPHRACGLLGTGAFSRALGGEQHWRFAVFTGLSLNVVADETVAGAGLTAGATNTLPVIQVRGGDQGWMKLAQQSGKVLVTLLSTMEDEVLGCSARTQHQAAAIEARAARGLLQSLQRVAPAMRDRPSRPSM